MNVEHLARMRDRQPLLGNPYMFFARSYPTSRSKANLKKLPQLDVCDSSHLHGEAFKFPFLASNYPHKNKTMEDDEPGYEKTFGGLWTSGD